MPPLYKKKICCIKFFCLFTTTLLPYVMMFPWCTNGAFTSKHFQFCKLNVATVWKTSSLSSLVDKMSLWILRAAVVP